MCGCLDWATPGAWEWPSSPAAGATSPSCWPIAAVERDGDSIADARIALGGVAGSPVRAGNAEAALNGRPATTATVAAAAAAAADEVDPTGDIHGSADYRRDLVRAMVTRALDQAIG